MSYLNPVYNQSCPDPFVLKYCGEYWAYCTGMCDNERLIGVLHSRDLVHWESVGGVLEPLPGQHPCYWAPEVLYDNGRFYMYYSVGDEEHMQIRVAIATHPAGPFVDSGRTLTQEQFAIDAHVFTDDDGTRYLFYATDYLDHSHIGTGTTMDRMRDLFTLEGRPVPVTRARYDWQVYDPQRKEKGGVRWHTVEGPFVLKHKNRYYQMFSGGNWQNISYGVSYALSESLEPGDEWRQVADGERVLPVLCTIPGQVIGPGHNSVVRGPDNRQLYCVYHRWVNNARAMSIDPLDWAGERLLVHGPSTTPQPDPIPPTFADFFDPEPNHSPGRGWACSGDWVVDHGFVLAHGGQTEAEARCETLADSCVVEVSMRAVGGTGSYGIAIGDLLVFKIEPGADRVVAHAGHEERIFPLPPRFDVTAFQLVRIDRAGRRVRIELESAQIYWNVLLAEPAAAPVCLRVTGMVAAFAGFALTIGWEDLFDQSDVTLADRGWMAADEGWRIEEQQLQQALNCQHARITRGPDLNAYELVVNARLGALAASDGCYGFCPAEVPDGSGPLLTIEREGSGWALICRSQESINRFPLPDSFDPVMYQQFHFRRITDRLTISYAGNELGSIVLRSGMTRVGVYAHHAEVAFDMIRVTQLPDR